MIDKLLDNFELLADAPNGIVELRKMILQLAVQGKLVPQDPGDEDASILLAQIEEEKKRLIEEGLVRKKRGEVPPLTDIESNFLELPKGWSWIRLIDVGQICGGGTPSKNKSYYWGGKIPWVSPKDMKDTEVTSSGMSITERAVNETTVNLIPPGSILIVARSGILKRMLPVSINRIECVVNQDMKVVIPFKTDLSKYLQLMLKGNESLILRELVKQGMTVQSLKYSEFETFPFPLPPLAEQKRIVAKVDQLMALCDDLEARQQARQEKRAAVNTACLHAVTSAYPKTLPTAAKRLFTHFDQLYTHPQTVTDLRKTILQLAVQGRLVPQDPKDEPAWVLLKEIKAEKERQIQGVKAYTRKSLPPADKNELSFDLPLGWDIIRLDEISLIKSGVTKGRKLDSRELLTLPYLRVANVQRSYVDITVIKTIDIPEDELEKFQLQEGDLLVTEGGDWDKVGRTAIWHNEIDPCIHQNHVFRVRLVSDAIDKHWVMQFINSDTGRSYFADASKQTTNLASINMTQLRSFVLAVPPLAEQKRILTKIYQLLALCDKLEDKLSQAKEGVESLAASITHNFCKSFTGSQMERPA